MSIFACSMVFGKVAEYPSEKELPQAIHGMDIAEKDWLFFAADGSPLKPVFSIPARFNDDGKTYSNGVYSLHPASEEEIRALIAEIYFLDEKPIIRNLSEARQWCANKQMHNPVGGL